MKTTTKIFILYASLFLTCVILAHKIAVIKSRAELAEKATEERILKLAARVDELSAAVKQVGLHPIDPGFYPRLYDDAKP